MLQQSTLTFLTSLAKNNNKPWFDKHREEYDAARADFEGFVAQLLENLSKDDAAFKEIKAKDCIFRIYRDVRFSKDKTPYKSNFAAAFSRNGKNFQGAGYYVHLQPGGKTMAGGGMWMPEGPMLKAVRQEIDYNFADFKKVISNASFKKYFKGIEGEELKTLPQGYAADNPAIDYLKKKSYIVSHVFADKDLTAKTFASKCSNVFSAMKPLVDFLNKSID